MNITIDLLKKKINTEKSFFLSCHKPQYSKNYLPKKAEPAFGGLDVVSIKIQNTTSYEIP